MILITILAIIALILIGIVIFATSVGGAIFIVVFGDVIVCIAIIIGIIIHQIRRHR